MTFIDRFAGALATEPLWLSLAIVLGVFAAMIVFGLTAPTDPTDPPDPGPH